MLANLAAIGVRRKDPEQVVVYARKAIHLARELQALRTDFGSLARDARVAELDAEIKALSVN
ncbi:hypothetical protein [Streptomyces sp. MK37H]|uniref:hypothetical protein n=1 Tax=Streptomyces sp. MK37H TaxID=2699117 RepID=UPI001B37A2DF|nr:hypothetical protein [Streptomyces sp. MK37H]